MAQIALAWVTGKATVSAPIVGATRARHIDDAAAGVELRLTGEEVTRLDLCREICNTLGSRDRRLNRVRRGQHRWVG